jgi:hypothetical protein
MTYVVLDPPVNAFSPRGNIEAWIDRLQALADNPEFSAGQPREALQTALAEAHSWLDSDEPSASPASRSAGMTGS